MGLRGGAASVIQAWDACANGIPLDDQARGSAELQAAIETFGSGMTANGSGSATGAGEGRDVEVQGGDEPSPVVPRSFVRTPASLRGAYPFKLVGKGPAV